MTTHAVQWGEGLFLRPHHFQIADRWLQESVYVSENWNVGYAYGLRKIEIDHDALANWRVSLKTCHIRLQDGSHIRYPEDANLDPVAIPRDAFANAAQRAMVHLAIPRLLMGRQNAQPGPGPTDCRYLVETMEIEDENLPGNPQDISVRWPNVRLIVGDKEAIAGFDSLPLMRLKLGATESAPPEIDIDYIPPVLACDAWNTLLIDIITGIFDYLSAQANDVEQQITNSGVQFESGGKRDLELLMRLHSLNIALGYVAQLPFARGVHPFVAYTELCRVVGLIALFPRPRRLPELLKYDHDDLGSCFWRLKRLIVEQRRDKYVMRRFRGAGRQMRVQFEPNWLEASWRFYIGVQSKLSFSEVRALLNVDKEAPGGMDFTVASCDQVDALYRDANWGVRLVAEPEPPSVLPAVNWSYYRVDRNSDRWQDVERTLSLGIRFNEREVVGGIDKEEQILIRHRSSEEPVKISFALFAMESE